MATITPSALIESVQGKWNGSQFHSWKGINVVQSISLASLVHSSQRQRIRGIISDFSGLFYALSQYQKDAWDTFAKFYTGARSGFNAYVSLNASLKLSNIPGLSPINDAPESYEAPDTPIIDTVSYDDDTKEIIITWHIPSSSIVYVFTYFAVQVYYSNTNSASFKLSGCVQSDTEESKIDISAYPDNYCFLIRCRSMKENGIVSSYSTSFKICKTKIFYYDPFIYFWEEGRQYINKFYTSTLAFILRKKLFNGGSIEIEECFGLCSDSNFLYIVNTGGNNILKVYKSDLSYISHFGSSGSGDDQFSSPSGIDCDSDYLYICDEGNNRIKIHDISTFSFIDEISSLNGGSVTFNHPKDISVDDDYIYFLDSGNDRFFKINKTNYSDYIVTGSTGTGDNEFDDPEGIAVSPDFVFICDKFNNRIKKYNKSDLTYHSQVGSYNGGNDNFYYPIGIALNSTYLYIADMMNDRIKIHRIENLLYVGQLHNPGIDEGEFTKPYPICTMHRTF